ncbi:MAG: ribosome silencing factor [Candidatus Cloacimonadales bacterium]|nr:ribosome silencing factor [Candidatus Cloacimonadota bacterium]MDY0381664.1 ribosome silencing factor [Candidatus Cloacimonadaceae bacterium]MCB5256426.1 ribosome silencing factor [Candidatus Cloacimonadota bacterium]MCB5263208.1 ribosome silencing factor [Candidatus Cloacimonadota bacterium]MCB5277434.1 ribosome silencing factor [Candidatus Cloacimonadota bacterium]
MQDNIKLEAILQWLTDKKAENIRVYEVQGKTDYTDVIVVCEGSADLHNKAIATHLIDMAKENHLKVLSKEGTDSAQWILIDIGDVVVHIFLPQTRDYYKIDELFDQVRNRKPEEDRQ